MSGVSIVRPPPPTDILLIHAHGQSFPFLGLKLEKSSKIEDYEITLKVGPKLYEYLQKAYGQSEILAYLTLDIPALGTWTQDMNIAIEIMQQLKIMDETHAWLTRARAAISAQLSGSVVENKRQNESALQITTEFLRAGNILNEVEENKYLFAVAKDVIEAGKKDPDTIIYRLAMAIYHSQAASGKAAIPGIEDSSKAFLNLMVDEVIKSKYNGILTKFSKFDMESRAALVKTFLSFVAGAYLYYSVTKI